MEGKKMEEATKKKESRIKTWWTGVKAEFSRIIWPDKATIIRQTVVVVVITIIFPGNYRFAGLNSHIG